MASSKVTAPGGSAPSSDGVGMVSRLSTHDASHGAGHTRPVTSGKLFVAWSAIEASSQRPVST